LHTYFKSKVLGEFFGEFFCGHYYWYTSNESRATWKFKKFGWKLIQNMCFFSLFKTIKEKYFMYLKKKPIANERERDFIVGHCTIFSNFLF
jgi:hypothetical protein